MQGKVLVPQQYQNDQCLYIDTEFMLEALGCSGKEVGGHFGYNYL